MRLRWWQRLTLTIVGLALLGGGGVGTAFDWSGVGLTALIIAGVFVLLGAIVGAMPKGSFREGNVEWPDVDKHPRIVSLETEVAALRADVETARKESEEATDFLIDWIVAHEPPPDWEGDDGEPVTDDAERLRQMERADDELSMEISGRYFTGETYDDGIDVTEMEQWRDEGRAALKKEMRRQAARKRFGLPLNEEQPAKLD